MIEIRGLFRSPIALVAAGLFLIFGLARISGENFQLPSNLGHLNGDAERTVYRVFELARENAALPFWEVKSRFLMHDRNPAFFMGVAEFFIRIGFDEPFWLQLISALLFAGGMLFFTGWITLWFRDRVVTGSAVLLLLSSKAILLYIGSIHHHPYTFFFFNLMMFLHLRHLRRDMPGVSAGALAAYLLVCLNYWMYYAAGFVLLLGAEHALRGVPSRKRILRYALPAVAGAILTFAAIVQARDGFSGATRRVTEIVLARTVDSRLEGGTWYPDRKFMDGNAWLTYPVTVHTRVREAFGPGPVYFLLLYLLAMGWLGAGTLRKEYPGLGWMLAAAVSWNVLMPQHTHIHRFSGSYGYYLWGALLGLFFSAAGRMAFAKSVVPPARSWSARIVAPVVLAWIVINGFWPHYLRNLFLYWSNLWT